MNDDAIAQRLADLTPVAFGAVVLVMLAIEGLFPLVPLLARRERFRHGLTNVSLAGVAAVTSVAGSVLLMVSAAWATRARLGLLNLFDTPFIVRFAVALVSIDFFEYLRHRAVHAAPLLWRLHRVHHTDANVDATTAIRAHPLENLFTYPYFAAVIVLMGVDPLSLVLRTLITAAALAWHHSKINLPPALEAVISLVTPTPRTHRLHHARDVRFTDSNFGTLFTWWDRALGTWHPSSEYVDGQTGLDGFDSARAQSLWGVLRSPFDRPEADQREEEQR